MCWPTWCNSHGDDNECGWSPFFQLFLLTMHKHRWYAEITIESENRDRVAARRRGEKVIVGTTDTGQRQDLCGCDGDQPVRHLSSAAHSRPHRFNSIHCAFAENEVEINSNQYREYSPFLECSSGSPDLGSENWFPSLPAGGGWCALLQPVLDYLYFCPRINGIFSLMN